MINQNVCNASPAALCHRALWYSPQRNFQPIPSIQPPENASQPPIESLDCAISFHDLINRKDRLFR
jgi:hypothetical protein